MLENPFGTIRKATETSHEANTKVVEDILSPEDAKRYAELLRTKYTVPTVDTKLDDTEKTSIAEQVQETREAQGEWGKPDYIAWAVSFGWPPTWIESNFVFLDDGTVETREGLTIHPLMQRGPSLFFFPPNLKKVNGTLTFIEKVLDGPLAMPSHVVGHVILHHVHELQNVVYPDIVEGDLQSTNVVHAKNVRFPRRLKGSMRMELLTAVDVDFGETIDGSMLLHSVTKIQKTRFPNSVGGDLNLQDLRFAKDLTLPHSVGGDLRLDELLIAKGVTLPQEVGEVLTLKNLRTIWGLNLPSKIGRGISVDRLWRWEVRRLQERYPQLAKSIYWTFKE